MEALRQAISLLVNGMDMTAESMRAVMEEIMDGRATPAQIGAFLAALRIKGETVEEIAAAALVMRKKAIRIDPALGRGEPLVDTCGTGGDGASTFNVSTTAAFVVAGAGVKVAKHGNRSVSSRSGSADVLERLGVRLDLSPERVKASIERIGIGFLFAPTLHPAMKHAIGPRRDIGIRTIFNILGPLTNPAKANIQVLGVFTADLVRPLAEVLGHMGLKRAWVVHGEGGLDEISLLGSTRVAQWDGTGVTEFTIDPEMVGLAICSPRDLTGGSPDENAFILRQILQGEKGPRRDMVLMNAGAALFLAGKAENLKQGIDKARRSIDSGAAMARLEHLIRFSQSEQAPV